MLKEIWSHRRTIYQLSLVDLKTSFKASILSWLWVIINPLLMIGVYLFSFYASGDSITEISLPVYSPDQILNATDNFQTFSRIGWLIIGVLTWNYVGSAILNGSNSIKTYNGLVTKVGISIPIPPIFTTLSKTYIGVFTVLASWIVYMIVTGISNPYNNPIISIHILQLPLMLVFLFVFLSLWSLVLAPLTAVSKDIYNIVFFIPVFLQWITGVFLPLSKSNMNEAIGIIFRINPFNFLIDNVRGSIMGNAFFWNDWVSMLSFFSFLLFFILVAFWFNKKAKKVVVDLV